MGESGVGERDRQVGPDVGSKRSLGLQSVARHHIADGHRRYLIGHRTPFDADCLRHTLTHVKVGAMPKVRQ